MLHHSLLKILLFLTYIVSVCSYPMIFEVSQNGQACMDIFLPDYDDAHLIFLPLPDDLDPEVEDWFVTEVSEIARPSSVQFLKDLSKIPAFVAPAIKKTNSRAKVNLSIEREDATPTTYKNMQLVYFRPTVIQDLVRTSVKNVNEKEKEWEEEMGSYRFCVYARGGKDVHVVFDVVKISEYQERMDTKHVVRKDHLTPLELAFEESANIAKTVIDEMHYMEKREARMKQTSERTNGRVKWFSYLSISILLGVTYIQSQYLKGYFKKKKVL